MSERNQDSGSELSTDDRVEADKQAIAEVVERGGIAIVTTIGHEGSLLSRPLALQKRPFDGELYFFSPDPSDKTDQVRHSSAVNVAIESRGDYLSIAGSASISTDPAMIDELWSPGAEAWFEGGRDDPLVALIKVHAESAELLSMDSPKIIAMARYARAMITKEQPDIGDKTRLDL